MKEETKMVDVVSVTTGVIYRTFDMIWFSEMKRYIKGWIKENGFVIVGYENGTVKVCEKQIYDLVKKCYEDVIEDLNETQNGPEPEMPHTSEIIRDWKCQAADEWDWFTVEYANKIFDDIYNVVAKIETEKYIAFC